MENRQLKLYIAVYTSPQKDEHFIVKIPRSIRVFDHSSSFLADLVHTESPQNLESLVQLVAVVWQFREF